MVSPLGGGQRCPLGSCRSGAAHANRRATGARHLCSFAAQMCSGQPRGACGATHHWLRAAAGSDAARPPPSSDLIACCSSRGARSAPRHSRRRLSCRRKRRCRRWQNGGNLAATMAAVVGTGSCQQQLRIMFRQFTLLKVSASDRPLCMVPAMLRWCLGCFHRYRFAPHRFCCQPWGSGFLVAPLQCMCPGGCPMAPSEPPY